MEERKWPKSSLAILDKMMPITVFTPAYNRAGFLPGLYLSLCNQTCLDFEWIIVDDGSSDNTREVIEQIIANHSYSFEIRYFYKENGGKHTAINLGVREARGYLFMILDSDDSLPPTAIQDVLDAYSKIKESFTIAGICGLMAHHNGKQIGSGFPESPLVASSLDLRYKYVVTGDLMEVFRTEVMREFPFPEITGERFCPEALVWNRIAQKYSLYCFDKVIYYRDYLDGGLTDNIVRIRMKSPIASMMTYAELSGYDIPFLQKTKAAINYWRFRFCVKNGRCPSINPLWVVVAPVGFLMHLRDRKCL